MRGGQLGARHGEADVGITGHDQTDPGGGAIDRGDDRLGQGELIGEVLGERRELVAAWRDDVDRRAGIIAALLGMSVERL